MRRIDGSVDEAGAKLHDNDERCVGKLYTEGDKKKKTDEKDVPPGPRTYDGLPTAVPAMSAKLAPDPRSLGPLQHPAEKLEIDLDLDDELMVKINSKLIIEGYKRMGVSEAKLHIGDRIIMINGRHISSPKELEGVLVKNGGHIRMTVMRGMFTTRAHSFRLNKHGFTTNVISTDYSHDQFLVAHISYRPAVHLGISVNSHEGIVVISRVEPGSLAARKFEVSDIVIDIDGEPVHDKNEFRNLLMEAIDRNSYASVLIQRPYSPKSIIASKIALGAPQHEARDPPLPHDAMMIGRRAAQRHQAHENNSRSVKPILRDSPMNCTCGLQFHESASEFEIQSDVPEGKKLVPVPTRQQMSARLRNRRFRRKATNLSSLDSTDTVAPPVMVASQTGTAASGASNNCSPNENQGSVVTDESSSKRQKKSIVERMTSSLREKKNKLMGKKTPPPPPPPPPPPNDISVSDKKQTESEKSESSSRKYKKKKQQQLQKAMDESDRRKPSERSVSERRKQSERAVKPNENSERRKQKPDDYAEKKSRRH